MFSAADAASGSELQGAGQSGVTLKVAGSCRQKPRATPVRRQASPLPVKWSRPGARRHAT